MNGGSHNNKETTASVEVTEGKLSIRHIFYGVSTHLEPSWVTVKHPNPKRDNGLLVVIKGEHCGKYVRRVHHRPSGVMILAVMHRVDKVADTIMRERLELGVEFLCVSPETKEERDLNISVMKSLRDEARTLR